MSANNSSIPERQRSVSVKNSRSGARWLGFKFHLCPLVINCATLVKVLASLCLGFLICKMQIIIRLISKDCCEDERNDRYKALGTEPDQNKCMISVSYCFLLNGTGNKSFIHMTHF